MTANPAGMNYQWLNCDSNFTFIDGETNQTYEVTSNGNYSVIVSNQGCVDTPACEEVIRLGILENSFDGKIILYPNPTTHNVSIRFSSVLNELDIDVHNELGQKVLSKNMQNVDFVDLKLEGLDIGIYYIELRSLDKSAKFKILKVE